MKLGKENNGVIQVIEVSDATELDSLYEQGYELISETFKPSDDAILSYVRISNGWIEQWDEPILEASV